MHRTDPLTIGFVPPHYLGPLERDRGWPYFMAHSLSRGGLEVHVLGPLGGRSLYRFPRRLYRSLGRNAASDPGRRVNHARTYAKRIENQLEKLPVDVVISSDSV